MINKLIEFSIKNRFLVVVGFIFLAALGVYNFHRLPIDAVPDITNVQVQINTNASGLSTVQIEKQITFPIETAMSGLPKLEEIRSLSRFGFSQVTVVFKDGTDIYWARQLVAERMQQAKGAIPPGLAEPEMGPVSTGLGEIFLWAVEAKPGAAKRNGEPFSLTDLRELQDWIIRPQLLTVPGVTEVNSIGGYDKQIHIEPYPEKLLSYKMTFQEVLEALERNNAFAGGGYIEHRGEQYIIQASGLISTLETIETIPVRTVDGVPVYIRDLANVHFGNALRTGAATLNGEEAVIGTAMMLIGENSRTVSRNLSRKLDEVKKSLPEGVSANVIYDRTKLVNATISTVQSNLIEGAVLVIIVLFLILGNFRVALFVALSIPLSMLLAVTGMVHSKIDGNLLSLGAIDFGIIVDGSVVMAENIIRRFANEQHSLGRRLLKSERIKLAYRSASEVSTPVISGVAIIMIVYLPILTLTGIEGKMFAPMSQVVLFALLGSLVISFTLIPALIALFLTGEVKEKEGYFIQTLKSAYEKTLVVALANGKKVTTVAAGFLLLVAGLSNLLGSEFVPALDERDIALQSLRIPATSVTQSVSMQKQLEKAILRHPEIARVFARVGTAEVATDPMPPGIADGYLIVKPRDLWPDPNKTKLELIAEIEETVKTFPGNQYEFSQPIELRFNELISGVRSDVAVKIFGDDLDVLRKSAAQVEKVLKSIDGASDVKVEQSTGLTTLQIDVDREKVARYGIDVADVQDVVSLAVGGKQAGLFFEGDKRFDIVVRLPEGLRENLEVIRNLPVPLPSTNGELKVEDKHNSTYEPNFVPLHLLAEIKLIAGLNQVSRENAKRRIVIQSNVRGRDLGSFVAEASERIEDEAKIPSGYWYTWGGQFENLQKAKARLSIVVPVSLLLIFFILFSTFGSVRDSILVFSGVPFALTGGVIALLLRGIPFSISAGIGFIALSGVAVLDGVVMVSFIKQLLAEGKPLHEAVKEGALVRFRPVVMTSLVAALGLLPMALATSTGAEVQRPLATVVIGGVTSGLLLTLLVLPVLYQTFYRAEDKVQS
jgi:cobalt-zinc-cadmium resistance protein CzcA